MSRRGRHGRHPHPAAGQRPRSGGQPGGRPAFRADVRPDDGLRPDPRPAAGTGEEPTPVPGIDPIDVLPVVPRPDAAPPVAAEHPGRLPGAEPLDERAHVRSGPAPWAAPEGSHVRMAGAALAEPEAQPGGEGPRATCTVAQLRRFIKSRPWIPLHELRRRFGIYGGDDDVTPIRVGDRTLFIGLPPAEGRLVAELLSGGDVGYELSLDPGAPIVVGVYPMRPVPRG